MTLPDILPGHWETDEGSGMAKHYLDAYPTREKLAYGKLTDMSVAWEISMLFRTDPDFEPKLAMAKDRIRWLSAQLAARLGEINTWAELHRQDRARLRDLESENKRLRIIVRQAAGLRLDGSLAVARLVEAAHSEMKKETP